MGSQRRQPALESALPDPLQELLGSLTIDHGVGDASHVFRVRDAIEQASELFGGAVPELEADQTADQGAFAFGAQLDPLLKLFLILLPAPLPGPFDERRHPWFLLSACGLSRHTPVTGPTNGSPPTTQRLLRMDVGRPAPEGQAPGGEASVGGWRARCQVNLTFCHADMTSVARPA